MKLPEERFIYTHSFSHKAYLFTHEFGSHGTNVSDGVVRLERRKAAYAS